VFSLVNISENPASRECVDNAFDLIQNGSFVQAVVGPSSICVELPRDDDADSPESHWKEDHSKGRALEKPLWRVAFLSKLQLLALTLNPAIVDEWTIENIPRHLFALLDTIVQRDKGAHEWEQKLNEARQLSRKPSIQPWNEKHYVTAGYDGRIMPEVTRH
jgi:hypothetical protein